MELLISKECVKVNSQRGGRECVGEDVTTSPRSKIIKSSSEICGERIAFVAKGGRTLALVASVEAVDAPELLLVVVVREGMAYGSITGVFVLGNNGAEFVLVLSDASAKRL